jgi:hypothetical protein
MLCLGQVVRSIKVVFVTGLASLLLFAGLQRAAGGQAPVVRQAPPQTQTSGTASPATPQLPESAYDPAIVQKPIPNDQLTFLNQFAGQPSSELFRDKQFRKLMKSFVPDCMYHYGSDMPLEDALERVFSESREPVLIRDGRYVMLSALRGPYLSGRGFLWIDMQAGIGMGAFFFHPTNGEPTPAVTVFARQVREKALTMSELPPAFEDDLIQWATQASIPPVTTRYFIGGLNKRILLEHDEEYCAPTAGFEAPPADVCRQMTADAADLDATAAYYLDQIHYATNGTAWTIGQDQLAWIQTRNSTCGGGLDPLGCRIRVSRERVRVFIPRRPVMHAPHR